MNQQKGFTIIELIVVIAIIAVLAGIVMVNVSQYINKAKDSAIRADLNGLFAIAASNADSINSICGNSVFYSQIASGAKVINGAANCMDKTTGNSSGACLAGQWVAGVEFSPPTSTSTYWCADSSNNLTTVTQTQYNSLSSTCNCVLAPPPPS